MSSSVLRETLFVEANTPIGASDLWVACLEFSVCLNTKCDTSAGESREERWRVGKKV